MGFTAHVAEGLCVCVCVCVCVGCDMKVFYLNKGLSHLQTGEPRNAALKANFLVSRDWPRIYYAFCGSNSEERWYEEGK